MQCPKTDDEVSVYGIDSLEGWSHLQEEELTGGLMEQLGRDFLTKCFKMKIYDIALHLHNIPAAQGNGQDKND